MCEVGKTYYFGCSNVIIYFKMSPDDNADYFKPDGDVIMVHNGESRQLIHHVWEPDENAPCKCIGTDPLTFECEYRCRMGLSEDVLRYVSVVKDGLKSLGITASDAECMKIVDEYKWVFSHHNRAESPAVFVEYLLEQLNSRYLEEYTGSHNGFMSHQEMQKFLFNMFFGIEYTPILMHVVRKYIECKAFVDNGRIELSIAGIPYKEYVKTVLAIPIKEESLKGMLHAAGGSTTA